MDATTSIEDDTSADDAVELRRHLGEMDELALRAEEEFADKQQRLENSNAALRSTIAALEAQVEAGLGSVRQAEANLKDEIERRERLQAEWNSRERDLEESIKALARDLEDSREQEFRAKNNAKQEIADAQSLRFAAEAARDEATQHVASLAKELKSVQKQLDLAVTDVVVRQLATTATKQASEAGSGGDCTASLEISLQSGFASSRKLMSGLLRELRLLDPVAFGQEVSRVPENKFLEAMADSVSLMDLDASLARHGHAPTLGDR